MEVAIYDAYGGIPWPRRIRDFLTSNRMTPERMAELMDLSPRTVRRWLAGTAQPSGLNSERIVLVQRCATLGAKYMLPRSLRVARRTRNRKKSPLSEVRQLLEGFGIRHRAGRPPANERV